MNRIDSSPLLAGAAEIDITPAAGTHLSGDMCRLRPVEKVLHPLFARALVAGASGASAAERICLLSLDLCTIGNECAAQIRQELARHFGFKREAVMLHLIQNHSAPSLGGHLFLKPDSPYVSKDFWWVYQGDPNYLDFIVPRLLEVVKNAIAALEPVTFACLGRADGRIAHNRRFLKRNGWVQSQPGPDDLFEVLCAEGPTDPEVGVAAFKNRAGRIIAALLHHTGHPCSYFSKNWVTPSWPGAWCRRFKQLVGEQCVPLMINGCCGNINVWNNTYGRPIPDDETVADWLMQTTGAILEKLSFAEPTELGYKSVTLALPFADIEQQLGRENLAQAARVLAKHAEPRWRDQNKTELDVEWIFAVVATDLQRRIRGDKTYSYEVQSFRLGDLGMVGLIGEPFVEGQLDIKRQSPAQRTFVAHMCNGYIGYIPPRQSYRATNYNHLSPEGRIVRRGANLFMLQEDALERISAAARDALKCLFAPPGDSHG
ncbi:MAG: hypothetical protein HYV36_06060 [Lentisphaerae bacterium]|nr:hypothetical protein [Lentisphaerota bacterium]